MTREAGLAYKSIKSEQCKLKAEFKSFGLGVYDCYIPGC